MLKTQRDVHTMMKALGIPLLNEKSPKIDNLNFELLRSLVKEEGQEFDDAMLCLSICTRRTGAWRRAATRFAKPEDKERLEAMDDDAFVLYWWAEAIDAIVDSIVVLHNTSNAMGVDIEPFWDEVQRANMAKAGGPTRADGKKLKPEGWQPPDMSGLLRQLLYEGGWRQRRSYELAVAYEGGGGGRWEAEHFIVARSPEEACSKLEEQLHEQGVAYAQIWVYCVQELECSPGCKGLDVFEADFTWPDGWVHIERCDECDLYPHDQAAAESISTNVRFVCADCDEEDQKVLTEEEACAHEHDRMRVVVPEVDAQAAGFETTCPVLSENQIQFCRDALAQGLEVDYHYSGRGMEGKTCPAVRLDNVADFKTTADYHTDQMGVGQIVYARG